ncbi:hypothetical protein Tco_0796332 [Tanacetum coccineum]
MILHCLNCLIHQTAMNMSTKMACAPPITRFPSTPIPISRHLTCCINRQNYQKLIKLSGDMEHVVLYKSFTTNHHLHASHSLLSSMDDLRKYKVHPEHLHLRMETDSLNENEKAEVLELVGGTRYQFEMIQHFSCGENFSHDRVKVYTVASIDVLPRLEDLEALDSLINQAKVKDL